MTSGGGCLSLNAVGLFSGGKDSMYSLYLAEKQGIVVDDLITLFPTLPWPSPHAANVEALKVLAKSMGKRLAIIDFKKPEAFVEALKNLNVDALVAGDIDSETHLGGLKDVCGKAGLELVEPIYGRDPLELFHEIFDSGFKALITGVKLDCMGEEWLGFTISKETSDEFLSKIGSVDPLGEYGEFHTLVLECPFYPKSFSVTSTEKKTAHGLSYLTVSIV